MDTKQELLDKIKNNLSEMFVNDFDKINDARLNVNQYLEHIGINYNYDYNEFCVDFMDKSIKVINLLNDEELINLNSNIFVTDTISYMIKNKIVDMVDDNSKRNDLIIQHELQKFLLNI